MNGDMIDRAPSIHPPFPSGPSRYVIDMEYIYPNTHHNLQQKQIRKPFPIGYGVAVTSVTLILLSNSPARGSTPRIRVFFIFGGLMGVWVDGWCSLLFWYFWGLIVDGGLDSCLVVLVFRWGFMIIIVVFVTLRQYIYHQEMGEFAFITIGFVVKVDRPP